VLLTPTASAKTGFIAKLFDPRLVHFCYPTIVDDPLHQQHHASITDDMRDFGFLLYQLITFDHESRFLNSDLAANLSEYVVAAPKWTGLAKVAQECLSGEMLSAATMVTRLRDLKAKVAPTVSTPLSLALTTESGSVVETIINIMDWYLKEQLPPACFAPAPNRFSEQSLRESMKVVRANGNGTSWPNFFFLGPNQSAAKCLCLVVCSHVSPID
jgi:hypothetical protein